jgi:SAM-dependent methyltransferase
MEPKDHKDKNWWENYFSKDGGWELNGGRGQTRLFVRKFTEIVKLEPSSNFSILDAGCALGSALKHFAEVYPNATLHGIDFSATAIQSCKDELGQMAEFSVGDLDEIKGFHDIIYCSNTLEHFAEFKEKASNLALHCRRLCILVPYREFDATGKALIPDPRNHHQHTFERESFNCLVQEGLAKSVSTHTFSCPGAWGWTTKQKVLQAINNIGRRLLGRPVRLPPMQILFDIQIAEKNQVRNEIELG